MLIKQNPRLISFDHHMGVAAQSVHDFFKPLRHFSKLDLIEEVLNASEAQTEAGQTVQSRLLEKQGSPLTNAAPGLQVHSPMPVFDGPFSNQCYQDRVKEAYQHWKTQSGITTEPIIDQWAGLIFHLPYAFHAKRMCIELCWNAWTAEGKTAAILQELEIDEPKPHEFEDSKDYQKARGQFLRAVGKTSVYKSFVKEKLAPASKASSEIGNMYTCSIFTALMSFLEETLGSEKGLSSDTLGFFAYGSGAKSKVFEGQLEAGWEEVAKGFQLQEKLNARHRLSYENYVGLHLEVLPQPVQSPAKEYALERIGKEGNQLGARYYRFAN
ncbi:MAG: hydroxymethylglutaryl-CoA synthase [Bacteroidota bacterium]